MASLGNVAGYPSRDTHSAPAPAIRARGEPGEPVTGYRSFAGLDPRLNTLPTGDSARLARFGTFRPRAFYVLAVQLTGMPVCDMNHT